MEQRAIIRGFLYVTLAPRERALLAVRSEQ